MVIAIPRFVFEGSDPSVGFVGVGVRVYVGVHVRVRVNVNVTGLYFVCACLYVHSYACMHAYEMFNMSSGFNRGLDESYNRIQYRPKKHFTASHTASRRQHSS